MDDRINKDVRPSLESLLSGLNRDQLQSLLLKLGEQEPSLTEAIERQVALLQTSSSKPTTPSPKAAPKPLIAVDPKAVRRQVHSIIHSLNRMRRSEAYWQIGAVVNEIGQLVDQAWELIKADDGRQALTLLEAITEEYMSEWENLDDSDGEASGFFSDLGTAWTEAILSTDLTREERKRWADQFAAWQEELDDYGVDEAFDAPQTAALDGWDYPPLKRVLQGIIPNKEPGKVKLRIMPMNLLRPGSTSLSGAGDSRSTCIWLRRRDILRKCHHVGAPGTCRRSRLLWTEIPGNN